MLRPLILEDEETFLAVLRQYASYVNMYIRLISCLYLRQREAPVKGRGPESVRRVSRDAKVAPTPDYNGRISQVYECRAFFLYLLHYIRD